MALKYEPGSYVWIEDDVERFLPAKVLSGFAVGEPTMVETEDGEEVKLSAEESSKVVSCNEEALSSNIDDLIDISDLNEMSILHVLRIRFKKDMIYTNISAILISVNPFKLLPLYTPEMLDRYRNGPRGLPPHVFNTAFNSFQEMMTKQKDQSVVISGESGAGKSEATKLILQFITDVSSRRTTGGAADAVAAAGAAASSKLEQQILAANPILEAFGNAKTLRNNNSSRFGKLITVNFDKGGAIVGGGIINYLLEKSRVVGQTIGERNYHIFYQLLSTTQSDPKFAADLSLSDAALFDYLNPAGKGVAKGVTLVEGINDEKEFETVHNSFRIMGFSETEVTSVCKIVAGVLHLGNVQFKAIDVSGDEGSEIIPGDNMNIASALWGVHPEDMAAALTTRKIKSFGDEIIKAYSVAEATDARDAMVKKVYSELFEVMVKMINNVLSSEANRSRRQNFIGVLDIFGFESFVINTFEQLCINFCNEKLQFHFNEHIFKMEIDLYKAEGIVIPSSAFVDNQPTLDMLELARTGTFAMLDEECVVPRGSDEGFLSKLFKQYNEKGKEHASMIKPKAKDCHDHLKSFGVQHYAGAVFYNISGWLDKNRDSVHDDITDMLRASSLGMMADMFKEDPEVAAAPVRRGSVAASKKKTLGGQFKIQLNDLISTLNSTYPHFVRCMKSNDEKKGNIFTASRMQDQLRYAGLVEVCRIRKLGFPVRLLFDEFFRRYKCCALTSSTLDEQLAWLEKEKVLIPGEWAKGSKRVFLRTQQSTDLEIFRDIAITSIAVLVQKCARRYLARLTWERITEIIASLEAAKVTRTEKALKDALHMCPELPYTGTHLALVKECKVLLVRVVEELRVFKHLQDAVDAAELNSLQGALAEAARLNPPLTDVDTPLLAKCIELIAKIEALNKARATLAAAVSSRDIEKLAKAIAEAQTFDLPEVELEAAIELKARLEEEATAITTLVTAIDLAELSALENALQKAQDLGLDARAEVGKAKALKASIIEQMEKDAAKQAELEKLRLQEEEAARKRQAAHDAAMEALRTAAKSLVRDDLHTALQTLSHMGLSGEEITAAQALLHSLDELKAHKVRIESAIKALEARSASGIQSDDLGRLTDSIASGDAFATSNVSLSFPELEQARTALESFQSQAKMNEDLLAAIESGDRQNIRKALDAAENGKLDIDSMAVALEALRELEIKFREEKVKAGESFVPEEEEEPYDAAEEARMKRQQISSQPKYAFGYFMNLRTADDFAKGTFTPWGKNTLRLQHIVHQTDKLPKSITVLAKDANKRAKEIFSNLLGYMGDKHMPFPPMLAQDVLRKGFDDKGLRDEIYCQLIKQLTNNPRPDSVAKGWQLMCMCVATFPPSFDLEMYLMHFILERRDTGRGVVVNFAKYCLRTLEAMLSQGEGVGYVPQVDEIKAFSERPPILASISLVDGANLVTDLPITPDTNVHKILEMCMQWTELNDPRIGSLGIFVYDLGPNSDKERKPTPYDDLERTPRPLRSEDFLGDVYISKARQKRDFKLVFKKKIFSPSENYRGEDPGYDRLLYLQAEDEAIIQGNIEMPDAKTAAYLAGVSMTVCFGQELGTTAEDLEAQQVQDFISLGWRTEHTPSEWAEMVLKCRPELLPSSIDNDADAQSDWFVNLQWHFVEHISASPMYGMHWYYCHPNLSPRKHVPEFMRELPNNIAVAFNFEDIFRWGGSSGLFSIILQDETDGNFELCLITSQSTDIASTILDHIAAIMAEPQDENAEEE